jgi:NlpA lipoprotein
MRMFMTTVAAAALLAGSASAETIRVGVTAGPHAEITEVVKKVAAEPGLDIKVVEFTDYVIPNQALALKDLEANSFQHKPYLKNQISKTGWRIVKVANTITAPLGVYSLKYKKRRTCQKARGWRSPMIRQTCARPHDSCASRRDQVEGPEQRGLDVSACGMMRATPVSRLAQTAPNT